ncbi:hypothetical protein Tco_0695837 [Tanacetum coccineum]
MVELLFNKFKRDKVRVLLGIWQGSELSQRGQGILHDPRVIDGQDIQTTITHNAAFQTDDLDAYDSNCDDISSAKAVLMANLSSYSPNVLSEDLFKDFDNGLYSEINEVKMIFNQMDAVVKQCSIDKKYFDIQKKEIFLDNDRLLEHIIFQDVMNIVMHADSVPVSVLPANNKCLVHDNLEIKQLEQENDHLFKLLLSQDIVHICVNSHALRNDCREMQHYWELKSFYKFILLEGLSAAIED